MKIISACPWVLAGLVGFFAVAGVGQASPPPLSARTAVDVNLSPGDSWWIGNRWLPIDSPGSIRDSMQMFADVLNVKRIHWRSHQDEMLYDYGLFRKENLLYYEFFTAWEAHLMKELRLNSFVVAEAHRHGVEVFAWLPLFDFGGPADSGATGEYPYFGQLNLTLQHPEWMPVDRAGLRAQGGPIEFAYPAARKALIDLCLLYLDRDKMDGITFFTYCENYDLRFDDEFGYCQPIVDEYKRRYGVDIRTEKFNINLFRYLRGEYVTQFLRELKAELRSRGKKLHVMLNPNDPNYPEDWLGFQPTGHIYLDWELWVREGIVDGLITKVVRASGPTALTHRTVGNILSAKKGLPIELTLTLPVSPMKGSTLQANTYVPLNDLKSYIAEGLRLKLVGTSEASFISLAYPEQASDVLAGQDIYAIMRFLAQVGEGKSAVDASRIIPLAGHPNILMRRLALKALAKLKDQKALATVENALADPESSVRAAAIYVLLDLHGPQSVQKLIKNARKGRDFQVVAAVSEVLVSIDPQYVPEIRKMAGDQDALLRRMALDILAQRVDPLACPLLISGLGDKDLYVRYMAALGLKNFGDQPGAVDALLGALADADPIVQDRAATSLAIALVKGSQKEEAGQSARRPTLATPMGPLPEFALSENQQRALGALVQKFKEFGDGSTRSDLAWGFRPVGNAILAFGAEGGRRMQEMIDQKKDRQLAGLAWKVYVLRQSINSQCLVVPDAVEENARIYRTHPFHRWNEKAGPGNVTKETLQESPEPLKK